MNCMGSSRATNTTNTVIVWGGVQAISITQLYSTDDTEKLERKQLFCWSMWNNHLQAITVAHDTTQTARLGDLLLRLTPPT